jgi:hypothetical protein
MNAKKTYIKTNGKILDSDILHHSKITNNSVDNYSPYVEYKYTVNNKYYIGYKIHFYDKKTWDEDEVKDILENFPKGKKITVYYNPSKYHEAVLLLEYSYSIAELISGVILIILGFMISYLFYKEKKN